MIRTDFSCKKYKLTTYILKVGCGMRALKKRNISHNARKDIQLGINSLSLLCFHLYIYSFFFFPPDGFLYLSANDRTQVCDRSQIIRCAYSLSPKLINSQVLQPWWQRL